MLKGNCDCRLAIHPSHITPLSVLCKGTENELNPIIMKTFKECDVNLYGYIKSTNIYWGKKDKKTCTLYFTLKINNYSHEKTEIIILPFINVDNDISNIYKKLCHSIYCHEVVPCLYKK